MFTTRETKATQQPSRLGFMAGAIVLKLSLSALSLGLCFNALAGSFQPSSQLFASPSERSFEEDRKTYLSARNALLTKQFSKYQLEREKLYGYPLAPYLDYYDLNRRLGSLTSAEIDSFLSNYKNSYLSDKLRQRWLYSLAKKQRWSEFLAYYDPSIPSTALTCLSLLARYENGDASAMSEVGILWNVDHSQPTQCNQPFDLWIANNNLSAEMAWQRFNKAIGAGNRTLANYLVRYLSGRQETLAKLYIELGRYPHRITKQQRFQEQSAEMQNIIHYGIQRYARQNPVEALKAWNRYDAQQLFSESQRKQTQQQLAMQLLRKNQYSAVEHLIADVPEISNQILTEVLIREALAQQDWRKVYEYIQSLPTEAQQSERWLYWRARALANTDIVDPIYTSPKEIYTQLAMTRDFYAFLSADKLGREYHLGDTPSQVSPEQLLAISSHPAAQRARELRATGDVTNANREWLHMTSGFLNEEEHIAAAALASQWGWHNKTIHSLARAKSWDDLQLRFPLAYTKQVFTAAQRHQVSPLLLFAIARQESAFAEQARSPAGALGLMQLMPGTAQQTANKAGVAYKKSKELLVADKNITLGSFYITELLTKYNGNRILATAAYNAGPSRVDRWLKKSASQLPIDVWIETIPYSETRKYVQNVLAYSVIYGYRTGTVPDLLTSVESNRTL